MRIVFVLHSFPPRIVAGTEISVLRLAKSLSPLFQVRVIHSEYDLFEKEGAVFHDSVSGVAVSKIITHRLHKTPEETYRNPLFASNALKLIEEFQPQAVHFHHFIEGDAALITELQNRKIAVLATLHDYWAICGRGGQMLKSDCSRCERFNATTCAECLSQMKLPGKENVPAWASSNLHRLNKFPLSALKGKVREIRAPIETLIDKIKNGRHSIDAPPGEALPPCNTRKDKKIAHATIWTPKEAEKRFKFFRENLSKAQLISPSYFLREVFINNGFDGERIAVIENGIPDDIVPPPSSFNPKKIRFGFVGTPAPVKGVHQILLASKQITIPHSIVIFGDTRVHPRYGAYLRQISDENVLFRGAKLPGSTAAMFNQFDVLILPSIWWENAPVVLREARALKKPSITCDLGGMKETILDGIDGWLVKPADVGSLKEKMEFVCRNPEAALKISETIRPPVRTSEVIPEFTKIYSKALRNL